MKSDVINPEQMTPGLWGRLASVSRFDHVGNVLVTMGEITNLLIRGEMNKEAAADALARTSFSMDIVFDSSEGFYNLSSVFDSILETMEAKYPGVTTLAEDKKQELLEKSFGKIIYDEAQAEAERLKYSAKGISVTIAISSVPVDKKVVTAMVLKSTCVQPGIDGKEIPLGKVMSLLD